MYQIKKINAHPTVDFAAEELKKYLRMMMPECGEIFISRDPEATEGLRLGLMQDFGLDVSEAEDVELDDIVHVDVDERGNGILAGSNPRSILFAVYRYLQENGCRWLFPGIDGEFIPMQDIKPVKYHKMADCRFRGQCNEGAEFQPNMMEVIDFTPKIGLNVFMMEFFNPKAYYNSYYKHRQNPAREPEPIDERNVLQWKRQCESEISKRGLQFHDMGHGWCAEPFGATGEWVYSSADECPYPEDMLPLMAMTGGRRGLCNTNPNTYTTNICMSNPKARKIANTAIVEYAKNHKNVDFLHVWLADHFNNHCECDECRKKTPSDWYVIMMNELDRMLEAEALNTRIVFICYVDTSWPPIEARLDNPKRFTLLVAPISRNYTVPVSADISDVTYPAYQHNQNELFKSADQYVKVGQEWQEKCGVRAMLYEYHFYIHQYMDLGVFKFARVVYDDIINYKKHGLNGLINDCSQRSFWPNGFAFFLYGQVQFDTSLKFEDLLEDYFSHAYGEDWRTVAELFGKLGDAVDVRYLEGKRRAHPKLSSRYNPAIAEEVRRVPGIAAEYEEFISSHRQMPYRAQTVMFKLLYYYMDFCVKFSKCLVPKCLGAGPEAAELFQKMLAEIGPRECEIQTCFDQYMMGFGYNAYLFSNTKTVVPLVEQ